MSVEIKCIKDFSSENEKYPAESLLRKHTWKCDSWEEYAWVVFELKDEVIIDSIEICNHTSAFIEIFAANSSLPMDFKVLVPVFCCMSAAESKSKSECKRSFVFKAKHFTSFAKSKAWKYLKCVCSQSFNKSTPFGLSKIAISGHKCDSNVDTNVGEKFGLDNGRTSQSLEEDYFQKYDMKSKKALMQIYERRKPISSASDLPINGDDGSVEKSKRIPNPVSDGARKKLKVTPTEKNIKKVSAPPAVNAAKASTSKLETPKRTKPNKTQTKRLETLMANVVFVMSGYENPLRSQLRDKAIAMGAKYATKWDSNCTHLICAFPNTPKYNEVKNENGKIVSGNWIEDCYLQHRLLEWRNYMVGKYNGPDTPPQSEDETGPAADASSSVNNPYDSDVIYDLDTDEES